MAQSYPSDMARKSDTHIRVSEDTWTELNKRKRPGDSFDDVIKRLLEDSGGVETDGGRTVVGLAD